MKTTNLLVSIAFFCAAAVADHKPASGNEDSTIGTTQHKPALCATKHKEEGAATNNLSAGRKLKRTRITEEDAIKLIAGRAEVRSWKCAVTTKAAKAKGVIPHIGLDSKEGSDYVVHVYEEVPDDATTSHTATFHWYYVNKCTGKVRVDPF